MSGFVVCMEGDTEEYCMLEKGASVVKNVD